MASKYQKKDGNLVSSLPEKEREQILNKELKPFGLSLDNRIIDVYSLSKNPLKNKKAIPERVKLMDGKALNVRQYIDELKRKNLYDPESVINDLLLDVNRNDIDYQSIKSAAYERAPENPTLHAFEILFLSQYNSSQNSSLNQHIERCLAHIAYGVEIAYLIPAIRNEGSNIGKGKKDNTDKNTPQTLKEIFIKPEFESRLKSIESKIQDKIARWKAGNDKIECAAFVEILYTNKYIKNGRNNRQICAGFAKKRYHIDITVQMQSGNDLARNNHKKLLEKHFK